MRMTAVDAVWRLSSVMLICSAIMAPSIHWLRASVLLLAIGVGTFIVERDVFSRKARIKTLRKNMLLSETGNSVREVHKYIEFVNSDEMIPFVNPYQRFGYWIWAAITAVIVFSRTVL